MAPKPTGSTAASSSSSSIPLADHFFIAGIESSQIYDERLAARNMSPPPAAVEETIDEDVVLETDSTNAHRPETPGSPGTDTTKKGSRSNSRYSWEARKSMGSIIGPVEILPTPSNRSSATIKGVEINQTPGLSDEDFEQALRKFASERETFLEEIQVSAGTVMPQKPAKPRPRTLRIPTHDEASGGAPGARNSISRGIGSIRRQLSTINKPRRLPSVARAESRASSRTTKRLSGYNSVIPAPQPFHPAPNMHPLKRRYEPVLLDRYPTKAMVDESKRRCPFPDYVPMFAFPNDVTVVSSDDRPRSTWHGFAMTTQDGSKLHAICVTIWLPLNHEASDDLEYQCEAWRKANMKPEEREMANSLGERLAAERAKLSRLLAELPKIDQGTDERDAMDDEISAVEERIALMTDLLRPVRHAAASKIDGLTDGETGFWIPRVYGILGRDSNLTGFWKEWLKAVITPMTNGTILRVPPSSPKIGMWQPLERYVVNLCVEAPSPMSSLTQIDVGIRELHLYARKEAVNELPGSRNTDLYALFRCLSLQNVVTLFEYAVSESRIVLLSSHTAMLHLASAAITSLLYPLKWQSVFIPVLPARLIQALEAPCPYVVGVERRYENLELPDDDFVLVDLDQDSIESTAPPVPLPRQIRRKLMSLLQAAAPHHNRYGVPTGPPPYAVETFPHDAFSSENPQVFNENATKSNLAQLVAMNSAGFSELSAAGPPATRTSVYNAFLGPRKASRGRDRPSTSATSVGSRSSSTRSPPSPSDVSPLSTNFPTTPVSRNDSGYGLQASLREKRSGHFADNMSSRRASSFGFDRMNTLRRPSAPTVHGQPQVQPFISHTSSMSTSSLQGTVSHGYAPSVYAPSTLAASTIMSQQLYQPVQNTETTRWTEGHCLMWRPTETTVYCTICDERCDEGVYRCTGCSVCVHPRCIQAVTLVCPVAFRPDQVRAAFVRCLASVFYTYRRYMLPASGERRKAGLVYHFNMDSFVKSVPGENSEYMNMLRETQAFHQFIHDRESMRSESPEIKLFDEIILAKRNRGGRSFFSKSTTSFLSDTSDHLWRSASTSPPNSRIPGDYRSVVSRIPAKLDPVLMKEPRAVQGAPRIPASGMEKTRRKPIPSMLAVTSNAADESANGAGAGGAGGADAMHQRLSSLTITE